MKFKKLLSSVLAVSFLFVLKGYAQEAPSPANKQEAFLERLHSISSHILYDYVKELASDKYAGRLTGTEEYNAAAAWVADKFQTWGIEPMGDNGTYYQNFPNPYTLVFKGCEVSLDMPYKNEVIKKHYTYVNEFVPGSTSGSGEVTAEVIYVGYGITAPELGYDDYKGMDVKGKIVLLEREDPVSPDKDPDLFKKWRPYSFHQYKLKNAVQHGAKGMLYNYGPIGNPNNAYDANFIYSHVGDAVVADMFAGTGRGHDAVVAKIDKELKPQSFKTGKTVTIKNVTEYHPEGIGRNVIGVLKGSDPQLKDEVIIVGGHLDHLGRCYDIMPGANDNASAIAVVLGLAEALAKWDVKPKRSILFICFGAEEQGVAGSEYYLEHPAFPLEKTACFINMDGVGAGDKLSVLAAENYPDLWKFIKLANDQYTHRIIRPSYFNNLARPRLDAARFLWKGIPSVSFGAFGSLSYYHVPQDDIRIITPEIMEDLGQLLFVAVSDMADEDAIDFRK